MALKVYYEIPPTLRAGLASGELIRRGGVVQWAPGTNKAGQVCAWLRETTLTPQAPEVLGRPLVGKAAELMRFAGNAISILNLGATVGFGIATLRKLGKMDSKLDALLEGQTTMLGRLDELGGKSVGCRPLWS